MHGLPQQLPKLRSATHRPAPLGKIQSSGLPAASPDAAWIPLQLKTASPGQEVLAVTPGHQPMPG